MKFLQPPTVASGPKTSGSAAKPKSGKDEYGSFTKAEIDTTTQAVRDARTLCTHICKALEQYSQGGSNSARLNLSRLLYGAFRTCKDGSVNGPRVSRLRHIYEGISHNVCEATYRKLKHSANDSHILVTSPGRNIDVTPLFLSSIWKRSQRALAVIHEGVHMLQNAHGFGEPRDAKYCPKHKIEFDTAVFYPYHHQWFVEKLFKIDGLGSDSYSLDETNIKASGKK